jgi:CysZ protein
VYLEQPGLVRYWIVPIAVTLVALVASVGAAIAFHDELAGALWAAPDDGGWQGSLLRAAHWLFDALVAVVLVIAALALTLLVSGIVAAPFNGRLGEVVDQGVTGREAPPFALGRAAGDLGRAMVIETTFFALNALLLVTSVVVPVLAPVLGPIGLVAGALYFGIAYVEAPQASRGRGLADRVRFVARHPMAMLGFGTGVGLFLFVPLVNLLFMPAAVAGGVLLHAALEPDAS